MGIGAGVPSSLAGRRVLVENALYTTDGEGLLDASLIGSERDGGFAELVCVPVSNAHPIESDLTDAELASFPTAYVTAERMLNRARLAEGETILVAGASGGIGTGLVQLAKIRGARVVAIAGAGKETAVSEVGADFVVTREGDVSAAVETALDGAPLDVAADVVGGDQVGVLLNLLRPGGRKGKTRLGPYSGKKVYSGETSTSQVVSTMRLAVTTYVGNRAPASRSSRGTPATVGMSSIRTVRSAPSQASSSSSAAPRSGKSMVSIRRPATIQ